MDQIENLVTDRYIVGLDWRELNHRGMPKMEMLIAHNSDMQEVQASHPHPIMSDDARWMAYNAYMHGRSDVFVAEM